MALNLVLGKSTRRHARCSFAISKAMTSAIHHLFILSMATTTKIRVSEAAVNQVSQQDPGELECICRCGACVLCMFRTSARFMDLNPIISLNEEDSE